MTFLISADPRRSHLSNAGSRPWARLLFFCCSLVLLGCGPKDPPKVQVFPVSGRVTLEGGEIPVGAYIVLHANKRSDALPGGAGIAPSGIVKADGTFQITVYQPNDGAPPGEYTATIEWKKLVETDGETHNGPNVLPKEYAKPATSPLRVTVQPGPTELPPIQIAKKK